MSGDRDRTRLLVFGFDAAEAAQIRRIRSYLDSGLDVLAMSMRRANMNPDFQPFWDNIHLGETQNAAMGQRLRSIAAAIPIIRRNRARMAGTDVIVARNLDMLILAAVAQTMIRPRPALIYECLDIHGMMTDPGLKGRLARALERRLLARCAALITSSPAFVREYFAPMQGWDGPTSLIENKLWVGEGGPARPTPGPTGRTGRTGPIVLGWVGTLRCAASLNILAQAAARLGARLEIRMHGIVHRHVLPDFDAVVAAHPNITYAGPYDYPQGLEAVYAGCDLVWAQDLWQWGTNSVWLLPNRIYEAGYFGCPSVAVETTETGRRVADGLGWTVPEPTADALVALLERLDRADLEAQRAAMLALPETRFRQSTDEIRDAILLPLGAG